MKKASLADIAKSLGVSKTLVSMVLNNNGDKNGISPKTQEKVIAKAKEMNYKPNQIARGLRLGKSNTIGLIVADISNVFYSRIARAAEDRAFEFGYYLIICSSDENPEKEAELIQVLRDRQVDGIILSTTMASQSKIRELKDDDFPFVLIDRYFPDIDTNYIIVDNYQGAYTAVEHLIGKGYSRIGHLTISPNYITPIIERSRGYEDAIKDAGIEFDKDLVRTVDFNDLTKDGFKALNFLVKEKEIDAIFVVNNNLSKICLSYASQSGIKIPDDLALISFDDTEWFKFCNPPITSISQPIEGIGEKATDIIINILKNKTVGESQQIVLPVEFVERSSVMMKKK